LGSELLDTVAGWRSLIEETTQSNGVVGGNGKIEVRFRMSNLKSRNLKKYYTSY